MQRAISFDGTNYTDIANQINAFFIANAAFVGVSLSIEQVGTRYQALLLYTP